jgi:hypothetical protein
MRIFVFCPAKLTRWMLEMPTPEGGGYEQRRTYFSRVCERAVRMIMEHEGDHPPRWVKITPGLAGSVASPSPKASG